MSHPANAPQSARTAGSRLLAVALLLVGAVNFLPVLGVLGAAQLQTLYGVPVDTPELALLLRHRALLFGLLGGLVLCAVWHLPLRVPAMLLAAGSMLGFLLLAQLEPPNPALRQVAQLDAVACLPLALAAWLHRRGVR